MAWLLLPGALAVLAALYLSARYAWWRRSVPQEHPRILMYHSVRADGPDGARQGVRVIPEHFEAHIRWLREQGWTFMTMRELVAHPQPVPPRSVVITFDDGYADNFSAALPILRRYDAKATLYLVANRLRDLPGTPLLFPNETLAELLSDDEVRQMLDSGLVELGAHTLDHCDFSQADEAEKIRQLNAARAALEERFGVRVESFAYPWGRFTAGDPQRVAAAGYSSAVTTEPGITPWPARDRYRIARIKISGKDRRGNLLALRLRLRGGKRGLRK